MRMMAVAVGLFSVLAIAAAVVVVVFAAVTIGLLS